MRLTIGVSDMRVSDNPDDTLVTHSLGSCIGISVHDPAIPAAGLLHFQLPLSSEARCVSGNPCMFADTGVPALFRAMYHLGADKKRIIVKVAGGSRIMDKSGFFNIGERNYVALRRILWKNGVFIASEDVGGDSWRTMVISVESGVVQIRSRSEEYLI